MQGTQAVLPPPRPPPLPSGHRAEALRLILDALESLHPVHRMASATRPLTRAETKREDWRNVFLRTDLGVLDCLSDMKGIGDYQACLARSISIDLGKFAIRGLSLEALIDAKRAVGRPRDLHTAEELEVIHMRREE